MTGCGRCPRRLERESKPAQGCGTVTVLTWNRDDEERTHLRGAKSRHFASNPYSDWTYTWRMHNRKASSQTGQNEVDTYSCDRIISRCHATLFDEIGCDTDLGWDQCGKVSSSYTMCSGTFGTMPIGTPLNLTISLQRLDLYLAQV